MFSCEFFDISKNIFFAEHIETTASYLTLHEKRRAYLILFLFGWLNQILPIPPLVPFPLNALPRKNEVNNLTLCAEEYWFFSGAFFKIGKNNEDRMYFYKKTLRSRFITNQQLLVQANVDIFKTYVIKRDIMFGI